MKSISLKLADGLDQQLETTAQAQQVTKSDVVREALAMYFTRGAFNHPGSCLMLAGDLVGSVDGPEDLSSAQGYLNGFGE